MSPISRGIFFSIRYFNDTEIDFIIIVIVGGGDNVRTVDTELFAEVEVNSGAYIY